MNIFLCLKAGVFLVLCYWHRTKGKRPPTIIVEKKIIDYGQSLQLLCKIDNCCPKAAEWRVDMAVIFFDVRLLDPSLNLRYPRFKANHNSSGISFVIQNFSSSDLNTTHECFYDDDQANVTLLYDYVFSSAMEETTRRDETATNNTPKVEDKWIITGIVIAVVIVIGALLLFCKKFRDRLFSLCYKNRRGNQNSDDKKARGMEDKQLSPIHMDSQEDIQLSQTKSQKTEHESTIRSRILEIPDGQEDMPPSEKNTKYLKYERFSGKETNNPINSRLIKVIYECDMPSDNQSSK